MKKENICFCTVIFLCTIIFGIPQKVNAQHYAEEYGWHFDNWPEDELSWEIYRRSFIGIQPEYDPLSSAFDVIFYKEVYKNSLTESGSCFGMSLLSLMMIKYGGYLGFCLPIPIYSGEIVDDDTDDDDGPTSDNLRKAIHQMHGHQVGLDALRFTLEIIALGNQRDGNYACDQFEYYMMNEDFVVVSITEKELPTEGGAHTMVPYYLEETGNIKKLYVYDPNRTWADASKRDWYENNNNYIEVNTDNHSWKFDLGGSVWSGSPSSGGNITVMPISVIGPTQRVPTSLGMNVGSLLATFFISGEDAVITQVTDSQGKRLFVPGSNEIDIDPSTGMVNTIPWFFSDQSSATKNAGRKIVYFMLGSTHGPLDFEIRCKEGYRFGIINGKTFLSLQTKGGSGKELITLENIGTEKPEVILRNQIGAKYYTLAINTILQFRKQSRIFQLNNLRIPKGSTSIVAVGQNQEALKINSGKKAMSFDIKLTNVFESKPSVLQKEQLNLQADFMQVIKPKNWRTLRAEELDIKQSSYIIQPDRLKPIRERKLQK